jgi:type VI protein secretion system component VasK
MREIQEEKQSLWLLTLSPTIWAAHLLLSYVTASLWCAKAVGPGGSLQAVRIAIGLFTVMALAGIGITGWRGYRKHRYGAGDLPHDEDTPEDRHRFLGFATFLLSALSAVAVLYAALVALFIRRC